MLFRPYPYVARDTAQNECIGVCRIFERKEQPDYEQFGELKFKYRNREFWCRGYYVDTVGRNKAKIAEYIRHQLADDNLGEQLSIPYTGSPFYGPPITEMQMSDSISACQGAAGKKALQAYKRNHRLCRWGPICVQGGGGTLRHPAG